MSKTLQTRTMQKIDTAANWAKATSFVPLKGEICVYSDTNQMKIGDNITPINDLSFASTPIYYIEGTGTINSDATVSDWIGSCQGVKTYFPGLMIAYKIGIAGGKTTTTLNLNNLGAVTVVKNASSAISTNFPINSIIILIYTKDGDTAYWKLADYDANTNTQMRIYRNNGGGYYPFVASYTAAPEIGKTSNNKSYEGAYGKIAHNNSYNMFINVANGTVSPWNIHVRNSGIIHNSLTINNSLTVGNNTANNSPNWTNIRGTLNVANVHTVIPGPGFNSVVHDIIHDCSYVDEVLEFPSLSNFPATGTIGKIYLAMDTHKIYRWSGSTYVEITRSPDHIHNATLAMSTINTSVAYKPAGTISKITHKPAGSVSANFAGAQGTTLAASITPAGTVTVNSTLKTNNHTHTLNFASITPVFTGNAGTTGNKQPGLSGSINATFNGASITPVFTGNSGNTGNKQPGLSGSINATFNGAQQTVSTNYTPAGTINAPAVTFSKEGVTAITSILQSSLTPEYNSTTKTLTLNYVSAKATGTAQVLGNNSSVIVNAPTFTGTAAKINHTITPSGTITINHSLVVANHNHSFTPNGTIGAITPAGTITINHSLAVANHNHSFTPSGTIGTITPSATISTAGNLLNGTITANFSGTQANHTHTFTPSGTVNATFSGTNFEVTPTFTGTNANIVHSFTPTGTVTISAPV